MDFERIKYGIPCIYAANPPPVSQITVAMKGRLLPFRSLLREYECKLKIGSKRSNKVNKFWFYDKYTLICNISI